MVRKIFIWFTLLAVILCFIGVIIIARNPVARIVLERGERKEKEYSITEIKLHKNENDCWIAAQGKVYDITLLLQIYEDEDLEQKCGEITDLSSFSEDLREILKEYENGVLK